MKKVRTFFSQIFNPGIYKPLIYKKTIENFLNKLTSEFLRTEKRTCLLTCVFIKGYLDYNSTLFSRRSSCRRLDHLDRMEGVS